MGDAIERMAGLLPRVARRADEPSRDTVAGQLATAMSALVEADEAAGGALEAAEHSDSHGRIRAMLGVRSELEAAAAALDRAGAALLEFYFEGR